jgi:hypothetical protein
MLALASLSFFVFESTQRQVRVKFFLARLAHDATSVITGWLIDSHWRLGVAVK